MQNFRALPATVKPEPLIACVAAMAEIQDRQAQERAGSESHARYLETIASRGKFGETAPINYGLHATGRGMWDRLRAQGFSPSDAAEIVKRGRTVTP